MSWRTLLAGALKDLAPLQACAVMDLAPLQACALKDLAPLQVCALDAAALKLAHTVLPKAIVQLCAVHNTPSSPAQLAVVMDALNGLDAAQARTLLARVRDFIAPRIVVIATAHCALDRLAFLSIGFEALGVDTTENIAIYQFDLNTYKQVPDWLNARHWAHPERWKP